MKLIDNDGNRLILGDDGIYLKLKGDPSTRKILSFTGGKIVKYVKKKNIFKPKNGKEMIGFNYYSLKLLKERTKLRTIYVRYGRTMRSINIDELLEHGKFLHFLKSGFELQTFYMLENMNEV